LPGIVNIESRAVSYAVPKIFFVGSERREVRQAVEITVQTDAPIPARAISPVIFVGGTPIVEMETVGRNLYKFYAIEPSQLQQGAAIAFGWPEMGRGGAISPAPDQLVATNFRYRP